VLRRRAPVQLRGVRLGGAPARVDLNDFDETLPGPWEWDVKRPAASMLIAAQSNGFRKRDQRRVVLDCVAGYRSAMRSFAAAGNLEVWHSRFEIESVLAKYADQFKPRSVKAAQKALAKARTKDSMSALSKLTQVVDGEVRIVDQSPLIVPIDKLADGAGHKRILKELRAVLAVYRDSLPPERRTLFGQFALADLARKVVGVGSVGTEAWIALLLGPVGNEPLFLQMKEAQPSVLEDHAGASEFANHGERVVVGQRLMQASSDIFLGWLRVDPKTKKQRDYYGRQLKDWKGSAEIEQMLPDGLATYGQMCGWTLARAHARTGDRVAIAAYLGSSDRFHRAILAFSEASPNRTSATTRRSRRPPSPDGSSPRPACSGAGVGSRSRDDAVDHRDGLARLGAHRARARARAAGPGGAPSRSSGAPARVRSGGDQRSRRDEAHRDR
jgi:uncharacterized protein (DUF2252 family)